MNFCQSLKPSVSAVVITWVTSFFKDCFNWFVFHIIQIIPKYIRYILYIQQLNENNFQPFGFKDKKPVFHSKFGGMPIFYGIYTRYIIAHAHCPITHGAWKLFPCVASPLFARGDNNRFMQCSPTSGTNAKAAHNQPATKALASVPSIYC